MSLTILQVLLTIAKRLSRGRGRGVRGGHCRGRARGGGSCRGDGPMTEANS